MCIYSAACLRYVCASPLRVWMNNPTGSLNQVTQTLATESFISQLRIASG